MSRRSIAILCLAVVGLVLALLPWTVPSERLTAAIVRQIRLDSGLDVRVGGRAAVSLLPVPRLKLDQVRIRDASGRFRAEAGQLKAELRPLALLRLNLRFAELSASDARITVQLGPGSDDPTAPILAGLRRGADATSRSRVERFTLARSDIEVLRQDGSPGLRLANVSGLARWPEPGGDLDLLAYATWRGDALAFSLSGLNVARLVAGAPDAVEGRLSGRHGTLTATGDLSWADGPRFAGRMAADTPGLGGLARWLETGLDVQDVERPVSVSGSGTLDSGGIEWPNGVLEIGRDRLEGSLALRADSGRPQLRATLAGDSLDLGWILPIVDPTRAEPPRSDYDVRLSASTLRLGPLRLRDAATAITIRGDRMEVSLARAVLGGGAVRGRLSAALSPEGGDIKGQLAADGVQLDEVMAGAGWRAGLSGTLAGQATFELSGERGPDLLATLRGRATVSARDGEIAGITLGARPDERSVNPARTESRGTGRTRFTRLLLSLEFGRGLADITDGAVETAATRTQLQGQVSLGDGTVALRTTTRGLAPDAGRTPVVLDMRGPIGNLAVTASAEAGPDRP